jgi:hypothetical protein
MYCIDNTHTRWILTAAALVGAATSGGASQGFAAFALLLVTAVTIVVS